MNRKGRTFLGNALLLSAVSLAMRGLGVSFQAYINRKIGAESMGLFTLVMSVYGFAVTVALSCVNLGAVRLTSERCAQLAERGADRASWKYAMRRVVRSVCVYSLIFGLTSGVLLLSFSGWIGEHLLHDARTVPSLRVLAFSLPAISLSSGLSGYFTGLRKVKKNAAVSVSEQLMKILVTSTALALIIPGNVESACLAVVGGSALAEAWSLVSNIVLYLADSGKPTDEPYGTGTLRISTTLGEVSAISFPSAVGAYARQGLNTLEHLAIPVGLRKSGLTESQTLSTYGALQGIAFPLILFPYAVIGSFTSLLIPEMAAYHELGDRQGIAALTDRVYRYSAIFSVGACGLFVNFAGELGILVYHSEEAARYTFLLGFLVPFMYLDTAVDALLKGMGEQVYSMKVNIADSASGLLLVLLTTPVWGIYGYLTAVWVCEVGNLAASIARLGGVTGVGLRCAAKHYGKPILLCALCSAVYQLFLRGTLPPIPSITLFLGGYAGMSFLNFGKTKETCAKQVSS